MSSMPKRPSRYFLLLFLLCIGCILPCTGDYSITDTMSWTNWNTNPIQNGPPKSDTIFTIPFAVTLLSLDTYHGNDGMDMESTGTIGLIGEDGTEYGPWDTVGYPGLTLNKNAHWVAQPGITLPAGTYTVVDSDPDTWSHNPESGSAGFCGVTWEESDAADAGPTSDDEGSWTIVDDPSPSEPSAWIIKDGTIQQNSNIYRTDREYDFWQGTHVVTGSPDDADYVFSFVMKADDNDGIGAIVRYQDEDNYYRFISLVDPTNKGPFTRLEKFEDGERTVIDESGWAYEPGKEYHVVFSAIGDELDVSIDGEPVVHGTDKTFSKGLVGFLTYAEAGFFVSDFLVTQK